MKSKLLAPAIIAAAAGVLLSPPAHATGDVTYTPGDVLLGFEKPGATNNYVVDLGPATEFVTLSESPGTTNLNTLLSLGNIGADLASSSGFGSNWATTEAFGSNVQWGVFDAIGDFGALGFQGDTLFLTKAEPTPGTRSTAPLDETSSTQTNQEGPFSSLATGVNGGFNGQLATANSSVAAFIPASDANSWSSNNPSYNAFTIGYGIEQTNSASNAYIGPTNSVLDLYELVPTDEGGATHATDLGSLSLNSAGTLDFTSAAVPEPSTYTAIGLGAIFLLLFRKSGRIRKPLRVRS